MTDFRHRIFLPVYSGGTVHDFHMIPYFPDIAFLAVSGTARRVFIFIKFKLMYTISELIRN